MVEIHIVNGQSPKNQRGQQSSAIKNWLTCGHLW